jgi:Asp-tRNA(Asn)/Glu-tRNA(Gln) amidotransferase A subunit family amidase
VENAEKNGGDDDETTVAPARSLARIAYDEDTVNAVMTVSRTALAEAEALDRERAQGKVRGPLHGIPMALKDNIHTINMPTPTSRASWIPMRRTTT